MEYKNASHGISMFTLPVELTIAQVEECKTDLLLYIEKNEELTFDDTHVSRIDTVGIQLLLAAITYISAQNKKLTWQCQSTVIQESIKQLGINEAILNQYICA